MKRIRSKREWTILYRTWWLRDVRFLPKNYENDGKRNKTNSNEGQTRSRERNSFRPFRRETRKIESTNQRMDVLAAKEVLLNPVKPPPPMEERKGLKGATKEPSYRRCSSSGAERKRDK